MPKSETAQTPASRIAAELAELQRRAGGVLYPAEIVEYARDPTTALHAKFTWDDGEAAAKWRLEEARQVIRVHVTIISVEAPPIRAFVSLTSDRANGGGYRPIAEVLSNAEWNARLLADAVADLRRAQAKYGQLSALRPVWEALAKVASNEAGETADHDAVGAVPAAAVG